LVCRCRPDQILVRPGQHLDRLSQAAIAGDRPMRLPIRAHQIGQHVRVPGITLGAGDHVTIPVSGRRQRIDRIHPVAGGQQRLHPRPPIRLDTDHHVGRLTVAEIVGHQRMQRRHPGHTLGQPATSQPSTGLVLDLHVVMRFRPVITDEQHRIPPTTSRIRYPSPWRRTTHALMDQCSNRHDIPPVVSPPHRPGAARSRRDLEGLPEQVLDP
jgi:hypothetical protein